MEGELVYLWNNRPINKIHTIAKPAKRAEVLLTAFSLARLRYSCLHIGAFLSCSAILGLGQPLIVLPVKIGWKRFS